MSSNQSISGPPCKWFFQITFSAPKIIKKNWTFCWFFEILSHYMCISKTSCKKNDFRTSRICWKITNILKTDFFFTCYLFFMKHKVSGTLNWLNRHGYRYRITQGLLSLRVFNIFIIFQQILNVLKSNFTELVLLMHVYWDKISKINKTSMFLTILGTKKSNLKKSLSWGTGNWLVWSYFWIPYEILVLKMGVCTQEVTLNVFQALRT